jgi:hypothetical protein
MAIGRSESDTRISVRIGNELTTTATQLTPVNHEGLSQAAVYIANFCTAGIHYDIKGCYNKEVSSTAYWYSIATGTANPGSAIFIGGNNVTGLKDLHDCLTVEYFASGNTSGAFVIQLQVW